MVSFNLGSFGSSSTAPTTDINTGLGSGASPSNSSFAGLASSPNQPEQPSVRPTEPSSSPSADRCPVDHETRSAWLQANPTAAHPFHPSSDYSTPGSSSSSSGHPSSLGNSPAGLSHDRVISSIPRSSNWSPSPEGSVPIPTPSSSHSTGSSDQAEPNGASPSAGAGAGQWVYPSEHQFFHAMLRKQHNPRAEDMRTVVPIHNAVNEKAWEEVLMWEAGMGSENCGGPRLVSFSGRPKDRTPKAWMKTMLG